MYYCVREAIVATASWKQFLRPANSKKANKLKMEMSEMDVVNMKFTSIRFQMFLC